MNLENITVTLEDGESHVSIGYSRLENEFSNTDRNQLLYANVAYQTTDFSWEAELPAVRIPYKDPSIGFLLGGTVFAYVGVYQRAPGIVLSVNEKADTDEKMNVDIVTKKNTTLGVVHHNGGLQVVFRKNRKDRYVPLGIFLKALSGLPYKEILSKFKYQPMALINAFPCVASTSSVDLSKTNIYGISSEDEPTIGECVDVVYTAIMHRDPKNPSAHSEHLKSRRIKMYLDSLKFKTESNYESTVSLHSRVVNTYFDQDLVIPVFSESGEATEIVYKKGTFIDETVASELKWRNVNTLRVKNNRSFLVQESEQPMLFRAVGYKLAEDIPQLGFMAGRILSREDMKVLNKSTIKSIDVISPVGRFVMNRSGEEVTLGDFVTICNFLASAQFRNTEDIATQDNISNRVVVDYEQQVRLEVEQTYQNIAVSIIGCPDLKSILSSIPKLPSTRISNYLRDDGFRELTQAEITNVMSRAISEQKTSALMSVVPAAMMNIQKGQYGRIDSLHAPESEKIGSVQQLTVVSRINENGEIETPYEIVRDGKPTGEIEYVTAAKEVNKYIVGWDDELTEETVMARYNDDITNVSRERVNYRDSSPFCDMSVSRMTIPFPEFSQPRRSLMATKMCGQAVPLIKPEAPIVSTGADFEIPCLYYTARQIVEKSLINVVDESTQLVLLDVKWTKNAAIYTCVYGGKSFTFACPSIATDKNTLYSYNLNYKEGYKYDLDDIVFYNQSCDMKTYDYWERVKQGTLPLIKSIGKPSLALGVNLLVGFKTYKSSTIDDAVMISSRLVSEKILSSVQIFKYEYELKMDESFVAYKGVPDVHQYVYTGEPVITIARRKKSGSFKHVFADQSGEVIYTHIDSVNRTAEVWVSTIHDAICGDKMAGRHGNKSVIARIVPEWEMPYDPETGETLDIVVSPLGTPSRMNYGLVLENTLGITMLRQNKHGIATPFYPDIKSEVVKEYEGLENAPMKRLFLPEYGRYTERPVMVGVMYFMKLEQIANTKHFAVGYPKAVDAVYGQPVSSTNVSKGQAIGEMETWALIAAGANKALRNMFTFYAPDERSRKQFFEILEGNADEGPGTWEENDDVAISYQLANKDSIVMQTVARTFGLDVVCSGDNYVYVPLKMESIPITVRPSDLKNNSENMAENEWCKVALQAPIVNPFWINSFPLGSVLGVPSIKSLVKGTLYLHVSSRRFYKESEITDANRKWLITGIEAVIALLENTSIAQAICNLTGLQEDVVNRKLLGTVVSEDDVSEYIGDNYVVQDTSESEISVNDLLYDDVEVDSKDFIDVDVDSEILADESTSRVTSPRDNAEIIDVDYSEMMDVDEPKETKSDEEAENEFADEKNSESSDDLRMSCRVSELVYFLVRMHQEGMDLSSLVWHYLPLMPKVFRQSAVLNGVEQEHSFQKQLRHMCDLSKSQDIYNAYSRFIDYGEGKKNDLETFRGYFFGKGSSSNNHGAVRGNVLKKRVGFSGRTLIIPAQDTEMAPYFVGIPWVVAMKEMSSILCIRMENRATMLANHLRMNVPDAFKHVLALSREDWVEIIESLYEFNPYVFRKYFKTLTYDDMLYVYNYFRSVIFDICCGTVTPDGKVLYNGEYWCPEDLPEDAIIDALVVIIGRQPTLHIKSIRGLFAILVDGYCLQIHPVICGGFNADFDGDTMYNVVQLGLAKTEVLKTIHVVQDLISAKDGSYTLNLSQDITLGLYCMTTFKDNVADYKCERGEFYFFKNAQELRLALEYGNLHYYDAVVYLNEENKNYYISTAGRVLLNAVVPGGMTDIPFVDTWGICSQVFGDEAYYAFKQLKYDAPWVATGIRPEGRPRAVVIESVQKEVYEAFGARPSVDATQILYELGLAASDIYGVTICVDDMSVDTSVAEYMKEPSDFVAKLYTLEQLGLISTEERKRSSTDAWGRARKAATDAVVKAIKPESNTFYLMYSGARGKPDQVMQTVGFIGNISKTATTEIEYPILRGYGSGLSSLDHCQTRFTARLGVIATQMGTKQTGHATRQSVYMTSGFNVSHDDCGIKNRVVDVYYEDNASKFELSDGRVVGVSELVGEFVDPADDRLSSLQKEFNASGYILTEQILDSIITQGIKEFNLIGRKNSIVSAKMTVTKHLMKRWRDVMLEEGYSYCLPYTDGFRVTEKTLDWIESHALSQAVLFSREEYESGDYLDLEAYLPVDYDRSRYSLSMNGKPVVEEQLYTLIVSPDSEGYKYYSRLCNDGRLSMKALSYLTKKAIRSVEFTSGERVDIKYEISQLFAELVLGRDSVSLPYLDADGAITKDTLAEIERYQLVAIPVRTSLTCLRNKGVCAHCRGKSTNTRQYFKVNTNVGITTSQSQCEPLSQSQLDVKNAGGRGGQGSISGLDYYKSLLRGRIATTKDINQGKLENFAQNSGYIKYSKHDETYFEIVSESGKILESYKIDDASRLVVPDGAFVDVGDTIYSGLPNLDRFSDTDVFKSAIKTRYLLLKEYYRVFKSLKVSCRNYENLARAQTTMCYLFDDVNLPTMKYVSEEAKNRTNHYILRVSPQSEVVNTYSGIAGFAFENVPKMLASGALRQDGLELCSVLGNIVTGTPIGSTKARFIPRLYGERSLKYKESAVQKAERDVHKVSKPINVDGVALPVAKSQEMDDVLNYGANLLQAIEMAESKLSLGDGGPEVDDISFGTQNTLENALPETTVDESGFTPTIEFDDEVIEVPVIPDVDNESWNMNDMKLF